MKYFVLILIAISTVTGCVSTWKQCAGNGYTGETTCCAGTSCTYINDWYSQCIPSSTPAPTPVPTPLPTPLPTPTPTPVPSGLRAFCPSSTDLMVAYGSPKIYNRGWTTTGGGGVATKTAFNLLGGYVEYDMDVTLTQPQINVNIYTISPVIAGSSFKSTDYCDGAKTGSSWCPEMDWIESNGALCGRTTYHMIEGGGSGCTAWGCGGTFQYNGKTKFHMKILYGASGNITTYQNGQIVVIKPTPTSANWQVVKDYYTSKGAVIYSSQWQGWVPTCTTSIPAGSLSSSVVSIQNLKVVGRVVQGPTPALC